MKKIMVTDVPAEMGGAVTILKNYYEQAKKETSIKWVFVTSVIHLEDTDNIENIQFPWVKKSWFHRLYFDYVVQPKLINKYNIDEVFSLDNTTVQFAKVPQTVYIHQSLPFVSLKFSFYKNFKLWIYQNIIGKRIIDSIKKADKIIVQTKWIKNSIIKKTHINENKIYVDAPVLKTNKFVKFESTKINNSTFFYPGGANVYKNHQVILDAVKMLIKDNFNDFKVIFTLNGKENKYTIDLLNQVQKYDLPIIFVGTMNYDEVLIMYGKSVLIFPSYLETFGLPLLEAKNSDSPILASDMPFSREILNNYSKASFFPYNDADTLKKLILIQISKNN